MFTMGVSAPVSLFFAVATGGAALFTGAATQALIVGPHRNSATCVAGLWAIAWAGTKPVASLFDGWSASHLGIRYTGLILVSPALVLALGEILLPDAVKVRIKKWSLSRWLKGIEHLTWRSIMYVFSAVTVQGEITAAAEPYARLPTRSAPVYEPSLIHEPDTMPGQRGRAGDDLASEICYSYGD
jgi:hypothetical protein